MDKGNARTVQDWLNEQGYLSRIKQCDQVVGGDYYLVFADEGCETTLVIADDVVDSDKLKVFYSESRTLVLTEGHFELDEDFGKRVKSCYNVISRYHKKDSVF